MYGLNIGSSETGARALRPAVKPLERAQQKWTPVLRPDALKVFRQARFL
jgi:hypothetical protein